MPAIPNPAAPVPNPPVNAGGQTAVITDALELALMGASSPAPVNPEDAPLPGATPDPANPATPPGENDPAQTSAETPAEGEPSRNSEDGTPTEGDETTVLSQTGDAKLDAVLVKLPPALRPKIIETSQRIAELIESGALNPGEVPRIGQLLSERHEMAESIGTLQQEVKELKETPPAPAAPVSELPAAVAKLKTIGEVKARGMLARENIRQLEDFLEENPTGGEIGGKQFERKEVIAYKRTLEDELQALPERAAQLQGHAQFQQAQEQARAKTVAEFPYYSDPENPDTKAARHILKSEPGLAAYATADYVALALARGHRELQAEKAARNGNGQAKPLFGAPGQRPALQGKVPLGKPHAPAGSSAPRPVAIKFTPPKPGERITEDHLENALAASGPRK